MEISVKKNKNIEPGMNQRIQLLRRESVETQPSLSIERALIETAFYKQDLRQVLHAHDAGAELHGDLQKAYHLHRRT